MIINTSETKPLMAMKFLIGAVPAEIESAMPHQIRGWMRIIERKLHIERNRGLSRHYRYDLNRHIALASAQRFLAAKLG